MQQNASPSTAKYLKSLKSYLDKKTVIIQGVLPTRSLFLGVHYEDKASLCTGILVCEEVPKWAYKEKAEEEDAGEMFEDRTLRLSSWFKKMMMDLNQKKLALVIKLQSKIHGTFCYFYFENV